MQISRKDPTLTFTIDAEVNSEAPPKRYACPVRGQLRSAARATDSPEGTAP